MCCCFFSREDGARKPLHHDGRYRFRRASHSASGEESQIRRKLDLPMTDFVRDLFVARERDIRVVLRDAHGVEGLCAREDENPAFEVQTKTIH